MNRLVRAAIPVAAAIGVASLIARLRRAPTRSPLGDLRRPGSRPRVVVLGAGFGGLSAALGIARGSGDADVVLVDQHNYHLFTPLLYQVAVGLVDSNSITYPLRAVAYRNGIRFVLGEAQGFDVDGKRLLTSAGAIAYDYLVVAMGSVTNFYGLSEVAERALPLKTVGDADAIRNVVLGALELGDVERDADRRCRLLTFPIVGGGPTGLELAGALSALVGDVAGREYPGIRPEEISIQVLEAGGRVLDAMEPATQEIAMRRLRERGVEIRLNSPLSGVSGNDYLVGGGQRLEAEALIWAAGVRGSPLLERLPGQRTRDNRVLVDATLRIPDHQEIFVIGDSAACIPEPGARPLPGTAPVAIQQGTSVARNVRHLLRGEPASAFRYRHPGNLVALGRHAAVAEVLGLVVDGLPAWLLWRAVHLGWLTGLRNRLQVLLDWSLLYVAPRQTEWLRSATRLPPRIPGRRFTSVASERNSEANDSPLSK